MQKQTIFTLLAVAIIALVVYGLFLSPFHFFNRTQGPVACTMEAKLCPDGSSVGRTGPNCEFAACPSSPENTLTLHIGESGSALGVTILPKEILEDSRCPSSVQCVWAGRVRVRAQIQSGMGTSEMTLTLNDTVTTEAETITLTEVSPAPQQGVTVPPSGYQLTFQVAKR